MVPFLIKTEFATVFLLYFISSHETTRKTQECNEESSMNSIKWPATGGCTISEPPCINEEKEFAQRCCNGFIWDPEPRCDKIQQEILQCPENFEFLPDNEICFGLTPEGEFPPKCPFDDVVPFSLYKDAIKNIGKPVWMPVTRDLTNGLGFLQWIEPSSTYKTTFEDNYYITDVIGKNCLVYYNSSYIVAVSCRETHSAVCAYSRITEVDNKLCEFQDRLCRRSDFSSNSRCFCLGSSIDDPTGLDKVEFLKPYQNHLYSSLTSDKCLNGLKRINGKYFWERSNIELTYTNWSPSETFFDTHVFGASTPEGWVLLTDVNIPCFLYEQPLEVRTPQLILNPEGQVLKLLVRFPKFLKTLQDDGTFLYCFSDATSMKLVYRYPTPTVTKISEEADEVWFQFLAGNQGPGHYWCEAFKIPNLEVIVSNVVLIGQQENFGPEFVALLRLNYIQGTNPLGVGIMELLSRILYLRIGEIPHLKDFYTSRIMKILEVDENNNQVSVNVHFTSKAREEPPNPEEEYNLIRNIIDDTLNHIEVMDIKMVSFRSPDFCVAEVTEKFNTTLSWPTTPIGQTATSLEFCFKADTSLLVRLCDGNFIDGGSWSQISVPCQIPEYSTITTKLIDLFGLEPEVIIDSVQEISEEFSEFEAIDVYLIAQLFDEVQGESEIDLEALSKIIDNIHRVDEEILTESQLAMNATDKMLQVLDQILDNHNATSNHTQIKTENFFLIISRLHQTNMSGLVLQTTNNSLIVTILTGDVKLDDLKKYSNIESAMVLSPELKNQIVDDDKLVVTLYTKNALFKEKSPNSKFVSKIFGVLLPKFEANFSGPISILHRIDDKKSKENCAYWHYGIYNQSMNLQGSWKKDDEGKSFDYLSLCQFWHTTNFALLLLGDQSSISDDLHLLEIITYVNCALSVVGLFGILMTAIFFQRWRINTGNQILINFVLAISLQIGTLYISNIVYQTSSNVLFCTIIGVILHYSIVSQFCWMFIIAILQFRRFVEVLGGPPKYVLVKACLCGWVLPLLPVGCVLFLQPNNYVLGHVGLCYPTGLGLYLGIWLPIAIIVAINSVIFIYIIYNVVHRKTECIDTVNNEVLFQWRLAVLLFFMLGLSWGFGLLTELNFGILFVYLFVITSTLQGFVMFLFFIVFNKNTRYLYCHAIKVWCSQDHYY